MTTVLGGTFYGWRVVGAAFVLAVFGWGMGFYGPPVYLSVVHETTGWPLALISTAVTVHFFIGAAAGANLPTFYRGFGASAVTKEAALSLAIGTLGWAIANTMAAVRGRAAQRSGLGRNECRSGQRDRVALVRARTTGRAGNGLQRWEYRRGHFLAALAGRD